MRWGRSRQQAGFFERQRAAAVRGGCFPRSGRPVLRFDSLRRGGSCFPSWRCSAACCFAWGCFSPGCCGRTRQVRRRCWLEPMDGARRDPAGELERLVNFSSSTSFGFAECRRRGNVVAAFEPTAALTRHTLLAQWSTLSSVSALAWNDALSVSATNYSQLMHDLDSRSRFLDEGGPTSSASARAPAPIICCWARRCSRRRRALSTDVQPS